MSTRYYGKKMSRSLSSSALYVDAKNDTATSAYMTMREGNKVYRVPVMVVHDPSRPVTQVASVHTTGKRRAPPPPSTIVVAPSRSPPQRPKTTQAPSAESIRMHMELAATQRGSPRGQDPKAAMESNDGNWTMKSQGYSKAETALKRNLQVRNNAVSQLFDPPEHIQHREGGNRNQKSKHSSDPRSPYVIMNEGKMRRQISQPAYQHHGYPVGATMPRAARHRDDVVHVKTVYQQQPQIMRAISVPAPRHRPPSPSSTIRDFEMSDMESAPSSPSPMNISSSEIQVRNRYQPLEAMVGPLQTSTPPGSTRFYMKRSQSDDSATHTRRGGSRMVLKNDTYERPGGGHYNDNVDGYRTMPSSSNRRPTSPKSPVVYRGEVVRVQVPAYKGHEELTRKPVVPEEYYTYPELLKNKTNLNKNTEITTTTAEVIRPDNYESHETTSFGMSTTQRIIVDNEAKTDINANEVNRGIAVAHSNGSSSASPSRSVSGSEEIGDEHMYSVAFVQHF